MTDLDPPEFVQFALDLTNLDLLFVDAPAIEFEGRVNEICQKYALDEETLVDAIEARSITASRLWRERHVPDTVSADTGSSDDLPDIPWVDNFVDFR